MGRYVPKTYNNWRLLRIIVYSVMSVLLAALALFLVLFFALENYKVRTPEGIRLDIPFLTNLSETQETEYQYPTNSSDTNPD